MKVNMTNNFGVYMNGKDNFILQYFKTLPDIS